MTKLVKTDFHLPYNPDLLQRAKTLRKNMTPAERKLWEYLQLLDVKIYRQRLIGNFIVDFYCSSRKLVIEVDGDSHTPEPAKVYDQERTNVLNGYRLQVVRFTNREVLTEFEGVCLKVAELLVEKTPPAPPKRGER